MNRSLLLLFMAFCISTNVSLAQLSNDTSIGEVLLDKCNYQLVNMPKDKAFSEGLGIVKDEKGNYGFVNKAGEVIITPKFQDVSPFVNGEATVKYDRFYGRINNKGDFTLEAKYSAVGEFSEGLISVNYPSFYEAYNIKEKKHIKFKDASIVYANNNYIIVKTNGLFGIMDKDGNYMVQPQFTGIYPENADKYLRVEKNNKVGYINPQGEVIIPLKYEKAFIDKNNNFILTKENSIISVNTPFMKSSPLTQEEFNKRYADRLEVYKNNYYYVKFVLKTEVKNKKHKKTKHSYIVYRQNKKYGIKKSNNSIVTSPIFDRKPLIIGDYAHIDISQPIEYLDSDYNPVLKLDYDIYSASPFNKGFAKVIMEDKKTSKCINKKGHIVPCPCTQNKL